MSSIIDDKNKTIYVIKENVGGESNVSNIIKKLILNDILRSKKGFNLVITHQIRKMLKQPGK